MKKFLLGVSVIALLAAGAAIPAYAGDTLSQNLQATVNQNVQMQDQWAIGVQWGHALGDGSVSETMNNLNAGAITSLDGQVNLPDYGVFNNVSQTVGENVVQAVNMSDQIAGGLQVGLADGNGNINETLSSSNIAAGVVGSTSALH